MRYGIYIFSGKARCYSGIHVDALNLPCLIEMREVLGG